MSNRGKLLKMFSTKELSMNTQIKASATFRGMTDLQKEERAGRMLTMLQDSKTEQEFISKMELADRAFKR